VATCSTTAVLFCGCNSKTWSCPLRSRRVRVEGREGGREGGRKGGRERKGPLCSAMACLGSLRFYSVLLTVSATKREMLKHN